MTRLVNLACDHCNELAYSASPRAYVGTRCPSCGEGKLHVDPDALADALGIPPAHPRRQELVEKTVRALARKHGIPVQTVEDQQAEGA